MFGLSYPSEAGVLVVGITYQTGLDVVILAHTVQTTQTTVTTHSTLRA